MQRSAAVSRTDDELARERVLDGIRELIVMSEERRRAHAASAGLAMTDVTALSHLNRTAGLGLTELARLLGLTGSSVTALTDRLERAGLAGRQPHADDRRRFVVAITPKGADWVQDVRDSFGAALEQLSPDTLAGIADALETLSSALAATPAQAATSK